jgi:predicted acetyltransferase
MKLSIITPDQNEACYIYRGHPWESCAETKIYSGKNGFALWNAVMTADAVLMCRPWNDQHIGVANTVKSCGKKLIIDWDDDYTCLPPWNPNRKHFEGSLPNLQKLAALADVVTVSSVALTQSAAAWGAKRVVFLPNAIDDSFKKLPTLERKPIVLWRGSMTHAADLEVGREYLNQMNATHEIVFFGDSPAWAYTLNHRHFTVSDYANYVSMMNQLAPEFVAVPLVDHPFNHSKSDVGAQEAFLIGAKLWHNGVGEYLQHKVAERGRVRWTSEVNERRKEILCSLQ